MRLGVARGIIDRALDTKIDFLFRDQAIKPNRKTEKEIEVLLEQIKKEYSLEVCEPYLRIYRDLKR